MCSSDRHAWSSSSGTSAEEGGRKGRAQCNSEMSFPSPGSLKTFDRPNERDCLLFCGSWFTLIDFWVKRKEMSDYLDPHSHLENDKAVNGNSKCTAHGKLRVERSQFTASCLSLGAHLVFLKCGLQTSSMASTGSFQKRTFLAPSPVLLDPKHRVLLGLNLPSKLLWYHVRGPQFREERSRL